MTERAVKCFVLTGLALVLPGGLAAVILCCVDWKPKPKAGGVRAVGGFCFARQVEWDIPSDCGVTTDKGPWNLRIVWQSGDVFTCVLNRVPIWDKKEGGRKIALHLDPLHMPEMRPGFNEYPFNSQDYSFICLSLPGVVNFVWQSSTSR